uniref:DUF4124 domain-containing protein n=1 Tax=uncultured gamma proteobacterium HF4000_36I10 TaxID=710989 RepID=E0XWI1_9GAMM|nr:hypothetical protein [uncultured gamma proteobacterium HF4000_36I10]
MFKKFTLFTLCLLLAGTALAKSGYYRWLDDEGQPHFTQKPPADRPSTFIESNKGYSRSSDAQPDSEPSYPPKRADSAPAEQKAPEQYEVLPDKDPKRCMEARQAVDNFARGQRLRVKDENGEYRLLNNEEKAEQKVKAKELVDIYC